MKRLVFLFASMLVVTNVLAQLPVPDGFYRTRNKTTQRYITVVDDYGKIDYASTTADMGAIRTFRTNGNQSWDNAKVYSNPGSIIYSKQAGDGYIFSCQGTDTYTIVGGYYLKLTNRNDAYQLYASSQGVTMYLHDMENNKDSSEVKTSSKSGAYTCYKDWEVLPITTSGDNYFGMLPTVSANGAYYLSFYASFPFSFYSSGMTGYYITQVDASLKVAVIKEIGANKSDVPASMPIIVKCSSASPANNRLDLHTSKATCPADNLLQGVYFCRIERQSTNPHFDVVTNDPNTMRVLGVLSDGSIGMKKYAGKYIPQNTAYLKVDAGAPDELKLMTEEEYEKAKNVKATGISLSQTSITDAKVGQTITLTATVLPENATDKSVTWSSSNTDVATVDAGGVVTVKAEGSAVITAKTNDGTELTATCSITVPHVVILATRIALNQSLIANAKVGDEYVIQATVFPEDADDRSVTWSSSNEGVATVDANGLVKILAEGSTTITATTNDGTNLSASCAVTVPHVVILATRIALNQSSIANAKVGDEYVIQATVFPENADDRSVTWSSSNEGVATVDANGLVKILAEGSTTITATTNDGTNLSASCAVNVPHVAILATGITLNQTSITDAKVGQMIVLIATVMPENAEDKSVTWSSSNTDVATVNADGAVAILAEGTAVITAKTNDGSELTASCEITVPHVDILLGDANGDGVVDVSDITMVASYILGFNPPGIILQNADANGDMMIDVSDITEIAKMILGLNVKLGDANGDGVVDVADITSVASYILGKEPADFKKKNADANQDGVIDVADITTIAGLILH